MHDHTPIASSELDQLNFPIQVGEAGARIMNQVLVMQKSSELRKIIKQIFDELLHFGIKAHAVSLMELHSQKNAWSFWSVSNGAEYAQQISIPFKAISVMKILGKKLDQREKKFSIHRFRKRQKDAFVNHVHSYFPLRSKRYAQVLAFPEMNTGLSIAENIALLVIFYQEKSFNINEVYVIDQIAKSFDYAYTRFLDLKKAEAQAREAQIEAALEKVRSASMAMHHTSELQEVINTVEAQFLSLELDITGGAFISINEEIDQDLYVWGSGGTANYAQRTRVPHYNRPIFTRLIKHIKHGSGLFLESFSRKEKIGFLKHLFKYPPYIQTSKTHQKQVLSIERGYTRSSFTSEHTSIFIINHHGRKFSEADNWILQRFATVFEQSYRRFLDLYTAETQAREAQIETSLERIRAASMAMQQSEELNKLIATIFDQLEVLGFDTVQCEIILFDPESNDCEIWPSNRLKNVLPRSYRIPYTPRAFYQFLLHSWKSGTDYHPYELKGRIKSTYEKWLFTLTDWQHVPKPVQKSMQEIKSVYLYGATTKHGILEIGGVEPIEEKQFDIVRRFADVFEQSFTRFLDLKKAEAQAREAQIETALEKVRSSSLAMQKTDDLQIVVDTVFVEMNKLDIGMDHTAIVTLIDGSKDYNVWVGSADANFATFSRIPYNDWTQVQRDYNNMIAKRPSSLAKTYTGAVKKEYSKYLFSQTGFKTNTPEKELKLMKDGDSLITSIVMFQHTGIQIVSYQNKVFTETNNNVLHRFSTVFEQAYSRFMDLQKAEAQAREAKIETALERVRSRTMGMQKSEELKEVIQVVYEQFVQLGIFIEHTGFIMDYKSRDDMHIWLADKNGVPAEVTIPYFDAPHWNSFIEAKEKGMNFFANHHTFKEKNKFYRKLFKHIPGLPEEAKKHYLSCPALAISTVLLDDIGLYIENFSGIPYTDEENNTLMRFGKVFQQTYTRFIDLQKAEAQAREAQIEAALERVRSASMAMHQSQDLNHVIASVFSQLEELGFEAVQCEIILFNTDTQDCEIWPSNEKENVLPRSYRIPYTERAFYQFFLNAWKTKTDYHPYELKGRIKSTYEKWLFTQTDWKDIPMSVQKSMKKIKRVYLYGATIKHGILEVGGHKPLSDEKFAIVRRFANVFEQSYIRFLDLKKAEAQARESQIEAALERVRSRTMAMHSSDDLSKVASTMFDQMSILGGDLFSFGIVLCNKHKNMVEQWHSIGKEGMLSPFLVPIDLDYIHRYRYDQWKAGVELFSIEIPKDYIHQHFELMFQLPSVKAAMEDLGEKGVQIETPSWEIDYGTSFKYGYLLVSSLRPFDEHNIFPRFAKVFEQAYTRFLDLQKAEAQAREAQIETALERVRSRTMAMQRSDELPEAANLLFLQVQSLGIPAWSAGYCIWENEDKKSATAFMSSEGVLQKPFSLPTAGQGYNFYVPLQNGVTFHIEELGGEEIKKHYEFMRTLPIFGEVIDGILEAGFPLPTFQIFHIVYFPQGYLMFITYEKVPHAHDIFKRFAKVFEQTYTRFLDLKQAEHQALLIRKEKNRLEKAINKLKATQSQLIHAEKMASLGELTAGIAHEIKNPLNFVNNFSEVSKELLEEMVEEMKKGETEEAFEIIEDIKGNLQRIVEHGKRADSIVKGMLMHSRGSSREKELTDMNALCDEYLRLAYHGLRAKDKSFNAEMETDLDASLPSIRIAPQEIGRVILNLITNAFHAVNEKRLNLGSTGYKPVVTVKTTYQNGTIKIAVIDNGGGIPDDVKDKIFQPFFTTKPTGQGTGLGLSLSYDIVKAHGGQLTVSTEIDKGSNFIITLPNTSSE